MNLKDKIFILIVVGLIVGGGYIWYTYQTMMGHNYFSVLLSNDIGFLGHFPTALFYIISIIIIGFHLYHGFQSSLKTYFKLKNPSPYMLLVADVKKPKII